VGSSVERLCRCHDIELTTIVVSRAAIRLRAAVSGTDSP
jgi:hypothetical protein